MSNRSTNPDLKTSLIIAPVALLKQWEREFHTRIKPEHRLKIYLHHGAARKHHSFEEMKQYDIVLTTYGVIGKEHKDHFKSRKDENGNTLSTVIGNSPFFKTTSQWYRIILDEAQMIKNKNTVSAIACCALSAQYRWCLSGTPMQNNVNELQSLIKFLRIQPYCDERKFNHDIGRPIEKDFKRAGSKALRKLQAVLKAIMLRRTKTTEIDGKPILQLPPRTIHFEKYDLDNDERDYYSYLENGAVKQMNKYLNENSINKNYSNILVMLLRLRQACCHPKIVERAHLQKEQATLTARSGNNAVKSCRKLIPLVVSRIKSQHAFQCPVCYDAIDSSDIVLMSPCGHHVCSDCCSEHFQQVGDEISGGYRCPTCGISVNEKEFMDFVVFEWVHKKYLDDSQISAHRQSYRTFGAVKMNSHTHAKSLSIKDTRKLSIFEQEDDEDEDIFNPSTNKKEISNGNGLSELKTSLANGRNEMGLMVLPEPTIKPDLDLDLDPLNKYSKSADFKDNMNEMIGPPVPREDLEPCFPRGWISSTKVTECLNLMNNIRKNFPGEKILVFSQFMSMLDFVEMAIDLADNEVCYGRYDGSMSTNKRHETVLSFFDDPELTVLLISLKAGNVGLTLTPASHIIILDPFWNPFVEMQAMDRAHRIGQMRPVHVHRLFIENSVEDRIYNLQEKKRQLIDAALDEKEIRNTSRLNQNELLYLFGLNSQGQRASNLQVPK